MRLSRSSTLLLLGTAAALLVTLLLRDRAPNALALLGDGVGLLWCGWLLRLCRAAGASARMQEAVAAFFLVSVGSTLDTLVALLAITEGGLHTPLTLLIDAVYILALLMLCHACLRPTRPRVAEPIAAADAGPK